MWTTNGVIQDAGTPQQGFITGLGIQNNGGPGICINSAPITAPYNELCFSVSTTGSALISLQNYGGAAGQALQCDINGVTTGCLGSSSTGTSTAGQFLVNSAGTVGGIGGTSCVMIDDSGGIAHCSTQLPNPLGIGTTPIVQAGLLTLNDPYTGGATELAGVMITNNALSIPSTSNYSNLRISQPTGGNETVTVGANATFFSIYTQPEILSGSSSSSNAYAIAANIINDGPGTTKAIHTGCFANTGSTGVCWGVNSQMQPVSTSGSIAAFASELTSSGVNNVAIAFLAESTGDQYLAGICGGCINKLPVAVSFIRWNNSSTSASSARFLSLLSPGNAEIYYVDQNGNEISTSLSTASVTIAELNFGSFPACAVGNRGTMIPTFANTATWGATITAAGSNFALAFCDGTNWTVAAI